MTIYSFTLDYVLMNPELAIRIIFTELTRNPLLPLSIVFFTFILGIMTEHFLQKFLKK